jgi:hypothetical protein
MWMARSGRWGILVLAMLRPCSSQIAVRRPNSGQRAAEFSGVVEGFFRAKAQRFCANDGDACGCRFPLGGVVVVILPALRLRVKTLDLVVSTAAALCVVTFLEASSWSPEFAWFRFFVFVVLVFFVFFSLSLICFLRGSPLHLVSVRPLVAI